MTKASLEEELQKRRIPTSVLHKLNAERIASIAQLAKRPDLVEYFENELKPIQLLKLKSLIKESKDEVLNSNTYDHKSVADDDCEPKESVLIEREQNATRVELIQQFQIECDQLKQVIDLILDDTDYVNEKAKTILEKSKVAHQCRANRLKQILLEVHNCTPHIIADASSSHQPAVTTLLSPQKQHKLHVRIAKHPLVIERKRPTESAPKLPIFMETPALMVPQNHVIDTIKSGDVPQPSRRWSFLSFLDFFSNGDDTPTQAPSARVQPLQPGPPPGLQRSVSPRTAPSTGTAVPDVVDVQQGQGAHMSCAIQKETRQEEDLRISLATLTTDMLDPCDLPDASTENEEYDAGRTSEFTAQVSSAEPDVSLTGPSAAIPASPVTDQTDIRPSALRSLQDLTAETDKFHVSMGPCEDRSSGTVETGAVDESPPVATTDVHQLCSRSRSVHMDFHELVHQLTALCWDVHHYNCQLESTMNTRRSLAMQYKRLPRNTMMFCFASERFLCKDKQAELDASQASLLEEEAILASTWDELHLRCKNWNSAAMLYNRIMSTIKEECLRWGTGLTLVSDISPLPYVDLYNSTLRMYPGLSLVAAGAASNDTLVSPCFKLYGADYSWEVWRCISRLR